MADERAGDAYERARHHHASAARDLPREPSRSGEAVEQQAGSDANDEQN
jgi:hypothetical protein